METEIKNTQYAFSQWRKIKKNNQPIPEELWTKAVFLGRRLGFGKVAKILAINSTTLKEKAGCKPVHKIKSEIEVIKVAPLSLSQSNHTKTIQNERNQMMAEIHSPSGVSVRIFSSISIDALMTLSQMIKEP